MMRREDLGNLNRVQHEGNVTVLCKRDTVPLILSFRSIWRFSVPANIDYAWNRPFSILRKVQVSSDVEFGNTLERNLLYHEIAAIDGTRDLHVERRSRRPGQKAQHVSQLLPPLLANFFPVLAIGNLRARTVRDLSRPPVHVIGNDSLAFEHPP